MDTNEQIEFLVPFFVDSGKPGRDKELFQLLEKDDIADRDSLTPFPFDESLIIATCQRRGMIMCNKVSSAVSFLSIDDRNVWERTLRIQIVETDNFHVGTPTDIGSVRQLLEHLANRQIDCLQRRNQSQRGEYQTEDGGNHKRCQKL